MEARLPPNFRADAFKGTALDYVRYRLPYPRVMLDDLLARAAVSTAGARLLDLACGPGRVALAIMEHFAEIWAVDLEPEMVAAGRQEAARRGISHIHWRIGAAETFEAPAGVFDLITIGEAFHRLDQPRIAALALTWLKRGGVFATLGFQGLLEGDAPWRRTLAEMVTRWIGSPAQSRPDMPPLTPARATELLRSAGFIDVADHRFAFDHEWRLDALLGNLRSTSVISRRALGERAADFERDLSEALLACEPSGRFRETISADYTLARKP
jgi:SAM-dependent methyltransferase